MSRVHENLNSTFFSFIISISPNTVRPSPNTTSINRDTDSPLAVLPNNIRGSTVERKPTQKELYLELKKDYDALEKEYYSVVEENKNLKSQLSSKSRSSVKPSNTNFNLKESYAKEVEDLYETLSKTQESIQLLLSECSALACDNEELIRENNKLAYDKEATDDKKDVKIKLLEETLRNKSTEVKILKKEKNNLVSKLKKAEKINRSLERTLQSKSNRIQLLEDRVTPIQNFSIDNLDANRDSNKSQ